MGINAVIAGVAGVASTANSLSHLGSSSAGSTGSGGGEAPTTILNQTKQLTKSNFSAPQGSVAVAQTYQLGSNKTDNTTDDPWQNTRDWYTTLGGDSQTAKQINSENMPF